MKFELLAPAGDKEKLETAFYYGADACYFAGKRWGLRAFSDNFQNDELEKYIQYAHKLAKKAYITVNIQAHNDDFVGLSDYLQFLEKAGADAIIVSDAGILSLAKQVVPNLPIHLSTQACASNKYSAKFWADAGATRIILARELSLNEIAEIRDYIPKEVELEAFVHGAMCISYSGRCLLSNYLANRDSNRGQCVQACRWQYKIREVSRSEDNELEIQEDNNGTYILNSKDLCMVNHIDDMVKAGVTSFKIEGRMKSNYYVATVVNTYRRVLDLFEKDPKNFKPNSQWVEELEKSSHRKFTTGFYLNEDNTEFLESSLPVSTAEFMAVVVEDSDKNGFATVEQRNRFKVGDTLEILSPGENFNKTFIVEEMYNQNNEQIDDALKVQELIKIKVPYKLSKMDMLRKIK